MKKQEITTTNLSRKKAFWFLIFSSAIITFYSIYKNLDTTVVSSYLTFSFAVISMILGTKANDTIQKFKNIKDIKEINQAGEENDK